MSISAYTDTSTLYEPFTPKLAWQLAAPHTWPAALMSSLVAVALATTMQGFVSIPLACCLIIICILMQSSANMLNDYLDFIKGTDSAEDNVEVDDAVLVYHRIDPKAVLRCGIGLLVLAFLLGVYPILVAGWLPLAIAAVGAAVVVLYSCGKTPVSYLPIGEVVIGLTMGGLMPLACYYVLTKDFSPAAFAGVVPCVFGVALILLTNNTCDIEKDRIARRRTLSTLVGRERARTIYHGILGLWTISVVVVIAVWYERSLFLLPFMALAVLPFAVKLVKNPLDPPARVQAMAQICAMNVMMGAFYLAAIYAGAGPYALW